MEDQNYMVKQEKTPVKAKKCKKKKVVSKESSGPSADPDSLEGTLTAL